MGAATIPPATPLGCLSYDVCCQTPVMISFALDKIRPVGHIFAENVCSHAHLPTPDDLNIFHPSSPCDGKLIVAIKFWLK